MQTVQHLAAQLLRTVPDGNRFPNLQEGHMVRSYHTLACILAGMILVMLVDRGLDWCALIVLGVTVPWDKVADIAGEVVEGYRAWRQGRTEQEKLEAAYR